jgi:crotonobetainyl-CoA:carnitine CoA-transferase CaiB-like acyl-CoA transferase
MIGKTKNELTQLFTAENIPNAPVMSVEEIMKHKQIQDREMLVEIEEKTLGKYRVVGNPMKLDRTPACINKASPRLGEDTDYILREHGLTDIEIQKLKQEGIVS